VRMRFNQVWAVFPLRFGSGVAGASRGGFLGLEGIGLTQRRKGAKAQRTAALHRYAPRSPLGQVGHRVCQAQRGAPSGWVVEADHGGHGGGWGQGGAGVGPDRHRERLGGRLG